VPFYAKLLMVGLVMVGTVAAQTNTGDIPQYGYCAPGIPCPPPEQPRTTRPGNVIYPGQENQQRPENQQIREEDRERYRRQQPGFEYGLEMPFPKPKEYTEFQYFVFSSTALVLPMYGYDLFDDVPTTFAPVDRIPVTADYVIGPGDEILIRAWGQVDVDIKTTVDRNGSIFIPKVGDVRVAGLRYQQLHGYLQAAIGRVFQNFDLNVTLGQLRSIQVFVVGQARRPGAYTVSSLSTLVNALFSSGGPSSKGSMRHIQLKRNNQVVTEFDLYDLLLNGDKSKDAVLLPGDVIYIPPVGPLVAIAGSVNVPAIYELRGTTTLGDVVQLAGLMTPTASGQKATVERIEDHAVRKIEEFPLDASGLARPLKDGDVVVVIPISPGFENAVTLRGNVNWPGRYPWHAGMRISDLIPNREMLLTRAYWRSQNLAAEDEDARAARQLILEGILPDPANPGTVSYGWVVHTQDTSGQSKADQGKTNQGQTNQGQTNPSKPDPGQIEQGKVKEESVGETLVRTGVKRDAPEVNWDYAVVQRLHREDLTTRLLPFNLGKAVLEHDEANNLVLEPGDIVTVFSDADLKVPIAKQSKFIQLEGEFKAAGVYQAQPGDTLKDLVARAGGLTENAYLFGSQFTRESTRIEQQKRLNAFVNEMAQSVERAASTAAQRSTTEDTKTLDAKVEAQRRLVQRLREVKATGRIVLEMKAKDSTLAELPDLPLEDGDRFVVPARPATVGVIGAVYNQNALLYRSGKRVSDYVRAAGGPTRDADAGRMFVIRADGSVVGRASTSHLWGSSFDSMRLMPGDAIVVPERLEKSNRSRELRDWVQLASQIALSAAVFRSLSK
jgi:protein involved in polysaccharide export with SLBB domain